MFTDWQTEVINFVRSKVPEKNKDRVKSTFTVPAYFKPEQLEGCIQDVMI